MAKRKAKSLPTDAELAEQATAEHHQVLAEHLPEASTDFDPAKLDSEPLVPTSPPELVTNAAAPIVQALADSTHIDDEEAERAKYAGRASAPEPHVEPLAGRDWSKFADPAPRHSVRFEDGYQITVQESPSRRTVEIQFGDGTRNSRPMHEDTTNYLKSEGMRWNGTNAWTADLASPRGHESEAEKLDRQRHNARIRTHVEDVVFPGVIALEEEKRGPVGSDVIRERIAQMAADRGR